MIITKEQYKHMELAIIAAEHESLAGNRAQVYFDTVSGQIWLGHLGQNERYPDDENYIVIYAVEPWAVYEILDEALEQNGISVES